MSVDFAIVLVLAAAVTLPAIGRGGRPERYAAAILIVGILFDRTYSILFVERGFREFSSSRLVSDMLQFAGYLWIALAANRIWPLFVAAAQLVCLTGSIAVLVDRHGMMLAYWSLTQLPIFVQMIALAWGTNAHRRRLRKHGPYRCWSPSRTKLLTCDA